MIKDIAIISAGYQFRGRIVPEINGNCSVLQVKDLSVAGNVARFDPSLLAHVSFDKDMSRYALRPGDVLFLSRGQRVYAAAIKQVAPNVIVPNYFYMLRLKKPGEISPEYLAWAINSPDIQGQLKLVHAGSHMPIVTLGDFSTIRVTVPSLSIQKSIVRISELADREEQLLIQMRDQRKKLIRHACDAAISRESKNIAPGKRKGFVHD